MNGRPVREEHGLAPLAVVRLEIPSARLAIVDPQDSLPLDRHGGMLAVVVFAKGTIGSLVAPPRPAASADQIALTPGIGADELGHGGRGTAGGAIIAEPAFLVPPLAERAHHRTEMTSQHCPGQIGEQARMLELGRISTP